MKINKKKTKNLMEKLQDNHHGQAISLCQDYNVLHLHKEFNQYKRGQRQTIYYRNCFGFHSA